MTTRPQNAPLAVRPLTVEVRSESDPNQAYVVTLPYCPCKDFYYTKGNPFALLCKHLKAALGIPDTSRLDEATAEELLVNLGASRPTAIAGVQRARRQVQGTVTIGSSIVVILYDRRTDSYDAKLAA